MKTFLVFECVLIFFFIVVNCIAKGVFNRFLSQFDLIAGLYNNIQIRPSYILQWDAYSCLD